MTTYEQRSMLGSTFYGFSNAKQTGKLVSYFLGLYFGSSGLNLNIPYLAPFRMALQEGRKDSDYEKEMVYSQRKCTLLLQQRKGD